MKKILSNVIWIMCCSIILTGCFGSCGDWNCSGNPKWHKKVFRGVCEAEVKRIIRPDELKELSGAELAGIIREGLSYNEFSRTICNFRSRKKAEGLQNVLYMCPHCKTLYSNTAKGNTLTCTHCGKQYHIDKDYRFTESDLPTIFDYYAKIKDIEKETLHSVSLDIPVDVKIFKDQVKEVREEKGVFHLDSRKVSFKSDISDLYFEYTVEHLEGIAYSCGEEFEMYHNDELYYFYPPQGQRQICTRVALLYEMLRGEIQDDR